MSKQYEQDIQNLQPFLKEWPQGIILHHVKTLKASNRSKYYSNYDNQYEVKSTRQFQSAHRFPQSESMNELKDIVDNNYQDMMKHLLSSLQPQYTVGDQFQKVNDLERISFEKNSFSKKNQSFEPENGVVYLVIIWSASSEPCYEIIYQSQSMIQQNPDWSGKAKIILISQSGTAEEVVAVANQMKWQSVEHYRILEEQVSQNDLLTFLKISFNPFILLINKWGKIVHLDENSSLNVEQMINSEINAEQDIKQELQQNNDQLIAKEEFKYLKEKIQSIQEAINELGFSKEEAEVEITLEKINVVKPDGTNEVLRRSKLKLNYDLPESEKEKINSFLENHWNTIPENLREITQAKIRDPTTEIQLDVKGKYEEIYASLGIKLSYYRINSHTFEYKNWEEKFEFETESEQKAEAPDLTTNLKLQGNDIFYNYSRPFKNKMDEQDKKLDQEIQSCLQKIVDQTAGNKFEPLENLRKFGQEKFPSIEHSPGQVLMLIFWSFEYNVKAIEKLMKILEKNTEQWGANVRIVFISVELAELAKDCMNSHQQWDQQYEFYFPITKYVRTRSIFGAYECERFLPIMIVDKYGTIRKSGNIKNFEELVPSFLAEKEPQVKEEPFDYQINPSQIQEILLSNVDTLKQADPYKIIDFQIVLKERISNDGAKTFLRPELTYFIRTNQQQELQQVLNQLFNVIPEEQWIINGTISRTVSIPYPGQECAVCKKDITQEPQQYYSPFKSEHVCTECAEYDDQEKKGNARFKYLDTLVFINGPLSDPSVLHNIDDHKLGKNMKLQDGDEGSQVHQRSCNYCGEKKGPRYISLTAKPGRIRATGYVDYCQNCFLTLKDKTSENAKAIVSSFFNYGTVLDTPYTRVLFNYGEYFDF